MTNILSLVAGMAAWLAAGGLVTQMTTTAPQRKTTAAGRVTVVGCVERADQVSHTGTPGTTIGSLDFVLIKAGRTSERPTGTAGTSSLGPMYQLDGDTSKLNPHVGHKVEVAGRLLDGVPSTTPPGDTLDSAPRLKVESIKMLGLTCAR